MLIQRNPRYGDVVQLLHMVLNRCGRKVLGKPKAWARWTLCSGRGIRTDCTDVGGVSWDRPPPQEREAPRRTGR